MIVAHFPVRGDKENIFWLQISVSQFAVVQKSNWVAELNMEIQEMHIPDASIVDVDHELAAA